MIGPADGRAARPVVGLVIGDLSGSGGMERVHCELIRRLSGRFDFVVLSHTLEADLSDVVTWHRIPTPRRPAVVAIPLFFAVGSLYAARLDVDILHTCGAIVGNRAQLSTVHFCHAGFRLANGGLGPKGAPFERRLNTALMRSFAIAAERWCYRDKRTEVLGAVSKQTGEELDAHYRHARVVVTPNGVDVSAFRPDHSVRGATRASRGVAPDDVVALFVGGDWERKGLAVAIAGIEEARRRGTAVRLWVLGLGDEERFRRYAINHGVGDLIDFIGRDSEPARWFRGADLFLSCSVYETFSLATVEAAAAGLPVVSTAVGVAHELVFGGDADDEQAGVVVERDPLAFGRVIATLAKDQRMREKMGAVGLRRAEAYSWDEVTQKVGDVYGEILTRNGARQGLAGNETQGREPSEVPKGLAS
jgi:glycosyltransferase involved in cell wall biosynthesis